MTISLNELIRYWQGRLPAARETEIEELLFEDVGTARRLDAVARLDAGVRSVFVAGKAQSILTVDAVEGLKRAGLQLRTYVVDAGQTVPCTVASEDLVVIRLRGDFGSAERVDVVMEGSFEGLPPALERYDDVPIDRRAGELVFVYPGERIRALPRSQFQYTVSRGGLRLGEYGLDHTPPS
ncbi:MAG: hypothetical protein WCE62_16195 [Polyangiales bacterium]